jgi:sirohydrochlorin cobaltochelatase
MISWAEDDPGPDKNPVRIAGRLAGNRLAGASRSGYRFRVSNAPFAEATLVLVGHGATRNTESTAPVYQHAATLRARGIFGQILECFWMVEPRISEVWQRVRHQSVFVVPVAISAGYFTTEVIPKALGLRTPAPPGPPSTFLIQGRRVHYCAPVGTHASMTDALLARALDALHQFPGDPTPYRHEITLLIAGHGTERNARSRHAVEHQVERIRQRGLFAAVHPVFMLEPPLIRDVWTMAATLDMVVVPFFISEGLHTAEDIPILLGEPEAEVRARLARGDPGWINPTLRHGRRLWYTRAIGTEPRIADVILHQVEEAAAGQIQPAGGSTHLGHCLQSVPPL